MSTERIFNIFIYFNNGVAREYGISHHSRTGDDTDKAAFLQACVQQDYPEARRFRLSRTFTPEEWLAVHRIGNVLGYFEEAFILFRAPIDPVFCVTAIVNGIPIVDQKIGPEPFRGASATQSVMPDY